MGSHQATTLAESPAYLLKRTTTAATMNSLSILLILGCFWCIAQADSQTASVSASASSAVSATTRVPPAIIVPAPSNFTVNASNASATSACQASTRIYRSSTATATTESAAESSGTAQTTLKSGLDAVGQSTNGHSSNHENRMGPHTGAAAATDGGSGQAAVKMGVVLVVAAWLAVGF